jgi:hypothetical protein
MTITERFLNLQKKEEKMNRAVPYHHFLFLLITFSSMNASVLAVA